MNKINETKTMIPELRTFIAVVHHGTFSAAGASIGLTQSAVSSQIRRLEDMLGFELFDRTRRTATLNAAGAATLAKAEEIVGLVNRLAEPPGDGPATGLLRVGAIASVQASLLPKALGRLRARNPALRVNIVPGVSMHLMDQVDSGDVDMAVMIRPPLGLLPDHESTHWVQEPFKLVVPASVRSRDWRRLVQQEPFLRYERKSFGGRLVDRFLREQGLAVHESIELDEIQGLIELVSQGLGVALVPMVDAHRLLPGNVRAISLGVHAFHREIGILQRRAKGRQAMVLELTTCLRAVARTSGVQQAGKPGLQPS